MVRRRHVLSFVLLAAATWLGWSRPAGAWGHQGHTIVCDIAYAELGPGARAEVDRLLRAGLRGMRKAEGKAARFARYGPSCAWPDRDPRRRGQSHYINTVREAAVVARDDCGKNPVCLFTAIERDKAVLRDPAASDREKLTALMYLGHWIGDLHQPLHVSYADDKGGNAVAVETEVCRKTRSLHWAWDTCLVEAVTERRRVGIGRAASHLQAKITRAMRARWRQSLDPNVWANESYEIARAPATGYCTMRDGVCRYTGERRVHHDGEVQRAVVIDETYVETHAPTVERRLLQAGVRLGAVLNDALR